MSSCQCRCHTPQPQAEACPVVVGMWSKGTWWCLARGLFYWAGASAMMTGGEVKGIRIIVWGLGAGRRRLQHQQRPAGDYTMKTNSQRWCIPPCTQLLPFGPARQPAISSHDPPSPICLRCGGVGHHARRRRCRQSRSHSFIISFPQSRAPCCWQAAGSPSHDLRAGRLGTWSLAESPGHGHGHGHHGRITHAGVVLHTPVAKIASISKDAACWFAAFRFSHSHSDF